MRYAIADIHGGSRTFAALLDKIALRHCDQLYLLGDYVDRGPDSLGVLEAICRLKDAGYDIKPIRGNHDDMLLRTLRGDHDWFSTHYFDEWGKLAFHQLWGSISEAELQKLVKSADENIFPPNYLNLLQSMPYLIVEDDYIFVHAGLNMSTPDPVTDTDYSDMIWLRCRNVDRSKIGGRQLVTGHIAQTLHLIRRSLETGCIRLDNGAYINDEPGMGNLVALNLDTKRLTIQHWCDAPANY